MTIFSFSISSGIYLGTGMEQEKKIKKVKLKKIFKKN